MAYKPLIVFITTFSIFILGISLNLQTKTTTDSDLTFAQQTGTLIENHTGDTKKTAENSVQKSEEDIAEPTSTMGLGFEDRTERENRKNKESKKHQKDKKITK